MLYQGSCHCGRIDIEVEGEIDQAMECNCTICSRKGYQLWFVPQAQLKLKTPESDLATYTFNRHIIRHHFCPTCGCAPFGRGMMPSGEAIAAINLRCLQNVDRSKVRIVPFDGLSK